MKMLYEGSIWLIMIYITYTTIKSKYPLLDVIYLCIKWLKIYHSNELILVFCMIYGLETFKSTEFWFIHVLQCVDHDQ